MHTTRKTLAILALLVGASLFATQARAVDPTSVPKWSQLPEGIYTGASQEQGWNVPSDLDWRLSMIDPNDPSGGSTLFPGWVVADDFRSDGRPITGVRWWGSYFNPEDEPELVTHPDGTTRWESVVEDGFLLSFFSDIPLDPNDPLPFSRPGDLLGSYIVPDIAVEITPMDFIGWDGHRVWQYEMCLKDAHLDHPIPGLSEPDAFLETEGTIYWLSIAAENGHELVMNPTDPNDWYFQDTNDEPTLNHFWGWHTSPDQFNDVAVDGALVMFGEEWVYGEWQPVQAIEHMYDEMAFELLTPIPEPSTLLLALVAGVGLLATRRRSRR